MALDAKSELKPRRCWCSLFFETFWILISHRTMIDVAATAQQHPVIQPSTTRGALRDRPDILSDQEICDTPARDKPVPEALEVCFAIAAAQVIYLLE